MKNKKLATLIIILSFISTFVSGCSSLTEENKSGYTRVTVVDGVVFDMPEGYLSTATAITSISKEEDYGNESYIYKDGSENYLMFNIGYVVVAVKSNTTFGLYDALDVTDTIKNNDINGIWFAPEGKKLSFEETGSASDYKMIAEVTADVSVTPTVYGNFVGKFGYVSNGNYECSMFVGMRGDKLDDLTSNQKKTIDHIVKSLQLTNEQTEKTQTDEETIVLESEIALENTEIEVQITEETETRTEVSVQETEMTTEEDSEYLMETEMETEGPQIAKDNSEESEVHFMSVNSNQQETVDALYSDIYHFLEVGEKGRLAAITPDGQSTDSVIIGVDKLYTGEEAEELIKELLSDSENLASYEEPQDGYSWHLIEYCLNKSTEEIYVNIKLLGLDGEKLRFRGVSIPSRTYDIFSEVEYEDYMYRKCYCYYEVPNGCKEYMLECGSRITDTRDTACFHITVE